MIVLRVLPSSPLQGRLGARRALGEEAELASPLLHGSGLPLFLPCPHLPHGLLQPPGWEEGPHSASGLEGAAQPLEGGGLP